MKRSSSRMLALASTAIALVLGSTTAVADTLKIGFIDPLSGTFGNVGEVGLRTLQMLNASGGVLGQQVELLPLDNKANAQEALIQLQHLIDRDVHFFFQGNSSAVAGALTDAVAKHNSRNPD